MDKELQKIAILGISSIIILIILVIMIKYNDDINNFKDALYLIISIAIIGRILSSLIFYGLNL